MICRHKLYHFTVANTRFTAQLTRRGKTKFATIKWYNLCRQIIQSQTCYPLIFNYKLLSLQDKIDHNIDIFQVSYQNMENFVRYANRSTSRRRPRTGGGGVGGVTSIIKVYRDVRLFRPPSTCIWMIFTSNHEMYINGYLFHPKSIWILMGKVEVKWSRNFLYVKYMNGYVFLTSPSIWMGWGSGTLAAHVRAKNHGKSTTPPPRASASAY